MSKFRAQYKCHVIAICLLTYAISLLFFCVSGAHAPKGGLDEETHARLKTCLRGSGYMTYELFKEWLEEFDTAMELEGRRIALVMDNVPGHGTDDG